MHDTPINPDREQQRRDNKVSREQSGLEPRQEDTGRSEDPKDRGEAGGGGAAYPAEDRGDDGAGQERE